MATIFGGSALKDQGREQERERERKKTQIDQ